MPTVIVPAYNEEACITDLLSDLVDGVHREEFQVIVACNGCSDHTADIVRNQFPVVTCLDIPTASKTNAINIAESLQPGFPRIYIDADVRVSSQAVRQLSEILLNLQTPAVIAPRGQLQTDSSDIVVRSYYAAWKKTVFFIEEGFGSGVYGLNRQAREKFSIFPAIISDDGFVRTLGDSVYFQVCETCHSQVKAPRSVRDLISIKLRSKLGKLELMRNINSTLIPAKNSTVKRDQKRKPRFLLRPSLFEFLTYTAINLLTYILAFWNTSRSNKTGWQRDESTRART